MIKFVLTHETIYKVTEYENCYFNSASQIVKEFEEKFLDYGCQIECVLFWMDKKGNVCMERPPFEGGYECWFGYDIRKDGQLICWDAVEGYTLGGSECFLYMRKKKKLMKSAIVEITYIGIWDDLRESIEKDFSILRNISQ